MRLTPCSLLCCWVVLLTGCAHTPKAGNLETLKPAVETFHQRLRWKDYRGAAELIVPDRRLAFEQARARNHDDRDLAITEYELEDARLVDGNRAVVVSRLSWMRLPSVSVKTDVITSEFIYLDDTWYLARQEGGPFAEELGAPYVPPAAPVPAPKP